MPDSFTVRPMRAQDAEGVHAIAQAAFSDLADRSTHQVSAPDNPFPNARRRYERILDTDPGGCFVAEVDGRPVGASMAIRRGGLWGLSLLAIEPGHQSLGAGRELLALAHESARGATARTILASADQRALRLYQSLGLTIDPVTIAHGPVLGAIEPDPAVRPGEPADAALIADVDTAVRGAPHGEDLDAMLDGGANQLVFPGRGYAMAVGGDVRLLAARDDEAAAALLRTAIAGAPDARVMWMTAAQQWAIEVCGHAGLRFELGFGAVMRSGATGAGAPYLPNGAFL